jgi:hypothetical protein
MGSEGVLWICFMEGEMNWNSSCCCWGHFDGKMPANNILYIILWAPADERRGRIINPAGEKMVAAGIEPLTPR